MSFVSRQKNRWLASVILMVSKRLFNCRWSARFASIAGALIFFLATNSFAGLPPVSDSAMQQIAAMELEKSSRSAIHRKLDSHFVYQLKASRGEFSMPGEANWRPQLKFEADGRVLVDVDATVSSDLLQKIRSAGGTVVRSVPRFNSIRASLPLSSLESLVALTNVTSIKQAVMARTFTGSVNSQGDLTHGANAARNNFGISGSGVKVGVISDSCDYLANAQATGDLPATVTVLPGQSGVPGSGEGTAMMEIVNDLAPGAQLYFATAYGSEAGFAQNILDLRSNGCDIIVDDVHYFDESPFQDGLVAQAVNTVTASGALYFSAAGNNGNKDNNASGTWEGDFVDGGAVSLNSAIGRAGGSGRLHSFGGNTYDTSTGLGSATNYVALFWSDPLGVSTNDYDLFVLNPSGTRIFDFSAGTQNGTQDPFEICAATNNCRIVIVKYSGAARFLHLQLETDGFGSLSTSTTGNITGHPMATNAFAVAAVDANASYPNLFTTNNAVQYFSSDGPRRVFYNADGSPITPGNFSSTGGVIRQKPDIAAANGVTTSVPGFAPFYGTSAAAPHAAALAALLWSYCPALSPPQIRAALTNTALDIGTPGFDRDSGAGIVMANSALQFVAQLFQPAFTTQPTNITAALGTNVVFSGNVTGAMPLYFQWRANGTNLADGGNISGATSNVLTLASINTATAANYSLLATNNYGAVTSAIAVLTIAMPPGIAGNLTNRTIECGANTNLFSITATGNTPLSIQWQLDGISLPGATNASFGLTNLFSPNHVVAVTVTNLYGSLTSNATLTVVDALPPVITLSGANRVTNELGSAFTDPGATANDTCAGSITVTVSGTVIINAVSTNTLTYTANDGNGNTNSATRTVIVRDTTPPVISWSFTNLVYAANSNCVALMPNVTGTNFVLATDLSGSVTVTQSPTNNATLPLGTNLVVLTAADPSGNKSYSTNQIVVLDRTPPVFVSPPASQTNFAGTTANFSVAATACTTLSYQWFFNSAPLTARTNLSLSLSNLTLAAGGNYFAVATAAGGSSTSAVATLTINLNPAALVLVSPENPAGFKDNLNFAAGVTPTNATGTVQFLTNGNAFDLESLIAGAAVSTNLSTLPRGTNLVTAIYSGDTFYFPATNAFAQIVTNHPPQVAPAFYTLVAGLNLNIAVADLATNWSDADGDAPFIASISASTNGVTVTNATPNLFYANPNYVNDQFVCAVSDGFGGTNFQTVTITVVPQTNATPAISGVAIQPASGITLKLSGGDGLTYVLESTTDLTSGNWLPVATNTLGVTGTWQFTDFGVTNNPACFYRLKLVQ
jgi:Subtilase family/Domain of unknown function (DUF5011)/Bacterial Ig-like domain (group 3)/Immunoglobulin I-set domain